MNEVNLLPEDSNEEHDTQNNQNQQKDIDLIKDIQILDDINNETQELSEIKQEILQTEQEQEQQQQQQQVNQPSKYDVNRDNLVKKMTLHLKASIVGEDSAIQNMKSLEESLRNLLLLLKEEQDYQNNPFNDWFFDKLLKLLNKKNPLFIIPFIRFICPFLSDNFIMNSLVDIKENVRYSIDLLNTLLYLIENLDNLPEKKELYALTLKLIGYFREQIAFQNSKSFLTEIGNVISQKFSPIGVTKLNEKDREILHKALYMSQASDLESLTKSIDLLVTLLSSQNKLEDQIHLYCETFGEIFRNIVKNSQQFQNDKLYFEVILQNILNIVERIFFQTRYYISLERNSIVETRQFTVSYEKQFVQSHPEIYITTAEILNHILLRPHDITLQLRVLNIIRRMYYSFPSIRSLFNQPIKVILQNISLYSENIQEQKEAAIFLYKLIHEENQPELKELLENNDKLASLKETKYYSIKAKSYPNDVDKLYNVASLQFTIFFPLKTSIDSGRIYCYNVFIEKQNSLLYWTFKTENYDIGFALYKSNSVEEWKSSDLLKIDPEKAVIKLHKVEASKNFISDNSYSYFRAKVLYHSVHVLLGDQRQSSEQQN